MFTVDLLTLSILPIAAPLRIPFWDFIHATDLGVSLQFGLDVPNIGRVANVPPDLPFAEQSFMFSLRVPTNR